MAQGFWMQGKARKQSYIGAYVERAVTPPCGKKASLWEVYRVMFRNSLIREMNFQLNFLLWILVEILWFLGQIVFIEVVFSYVGAIGGWTKWEVVLLIGTHQLIGQLFQAFFYMNLANLPELVRTGKMDFMLLIPVDTQFVVSVKQFGMDNVINAFVGAGFVTFALWKMALVPTLAQLLLYAVAVCCGILIHYSIMLVFAASSFWMVRSQGLIYGYYSLFNIGRYPDTIYRGAFKLVFSWLIPVIIVANIPSRLLIHAAENPWPIILQLIAATFLMVGGTRLLWNSALRHYSSASS
jgi:ABC-2 type transport system permease protein